jgi:energy-coupling factor transporter ATP-binding protein EcfA2
MTAAQQANLFLAYSRKDQEHALRLIAALESLGISIWWDVTSIPIGVNWEQFLTEQLSAAQCVVVLWSRDSVQSKWVLFEAEFAVRRGVFLPVLIDKVDIPLPFKRYQAALLDSWDGNGSDPSFQLLLEAIQRLLKTAPATSQDTRIYKESQRSVERRAQELFQENLRSESIIEHLDLKDTIFYKEVSWNLTPGINVLLGRNGYGKTFLLRGLLALLQYKDLAALQTIGSGSASVSILRNGREDVIHFSNQYFDEENPVGQLPVLAIPDTRFINRSVTALSAVSDGTTGTGDRADLARFGAWHFLEERPYESMIQTFLYGLCLDYFESGLSFQGEQFTLIRDIVHELTDKSFDFDRVAREGRDRFTLYVRTEGNEDNPLPIQKSSQGTSSAIAMIGLIYDYLKSLKKDPPREVRQRSGIVLIDEVDAHLHPAWQQKIVTILRDRFPRVQFILTAHNPIVVAGCLEDEVSVLRRNPERGFSLVQFPNDFIGWETEDIYRKVFDIENPDASFTRLDAMRPFKGRFQQEAAILAKQTTRSAEEERSLQSLEEQIRYIENVEQTRARRINQEELKRENSTLRDRLMGLESAHDAAADAQRAVDDLKKVLTAEQASARKKLIMSCFVTALITTVLVILILGSLGYFLR